ncbi:MAG TPA: hypothetical protein VI790_03010 [Candidatus Nanoarchaeia archaeon]|nr:hypothetical protein [Candidatus Nanoarchaeia archaeon]
MFDYHVHVSGMPITEQYKTLVKAQLKKSLDDNNIKSFLGIISPGSLYAQDEVVNPCFYHFFDIDSKGLNIVKELGGYPAVSLFPDIINLDDIMNRVSDNGINYIKLFYNNEPEISELIAKARDIDIKAIIIHTPSDFKKIEPVYDLISKNDIQLILGHGCYKSLDLIKKVKDFGFVVDTSINPVENIDFWITNDAFKNLVFGSDWPCSADYDAKIDWNAQKRELSKIKRYL